MYMCPIPKGLEDKLFHCTDEQHAMSSHELQSVHWCWRWNFRKCIKGKLYQFCYLNNKYRY
jgi:hypothetical protein